MKKYLFGVLSALVLCLCLLTVSASAANIIARGYCGGEGDGTNLSWWLTEYGELNIYGRGSMDDWVIPSTVPWDSWKSEIKWVDIGNGVTSIGEEAFSHCNNLLRATIPNSVTSIGNEAFTWCSHLSSIAIPDGVTSIGDYAFSFCDSLTDVTIPGSVTTIGNSVFRSCDSLTSVTFEESAPTFGADVFYYVTATCYYPANDPTWTEAVKKNYGGTLTWVAVEAEPVMYTVTYTDGVDGEEIFADQTSSMEEDGATPAFVGTPAREGYTFEGWSPAVTATVTGDVTYTAQWVKAPIARGYCGGEGDGTNLTWILTDNGLLTVSGTGAMEDWESYSNVPWYSYCYDIETVVVEDGVTTIGRYAFYECYNLMSVTISDSVTTVEGAAFIYCSNLTNVTLGSNVTTIGDWAFEGCESLTNVTIPDSVTTIGGYAFSSCDSLTSVTIPDSVTAIGSAAFMYCPKLTSVFFDGKVPAISGSAFKNVIGTCYYPANDPTWTDEVKKNYGGTLTWVAVDENGKPLPELNFAFARMILGNVLDMQFAFPKEGVESGAYVEVVRTAADGSEVAQTIPYAEFKSATISGVAHYYVTYSGIAAKEMADTIVATVYNKDGTAISNGWTDSVREYALRSLRAANATAKNKTMLVDMLNYGAAAQTYFNYNASDLANKDLTADELALATTAAPCVNEVVKGAKNRGSRLILESSIKVQQAFSGLNENMYATVEFTNYNGREISETIPGSEFQLGATSIIELDQIVLADARTIYTLTIYNADGTVYDTHVDSVASYIARASDNALYDAIMNFADGAYSYLH